MHRSARYWITGCLAGLAVMAVAADNPVVPRNGQIVVTTKPEGALVACDGTVHGPAPVTLTNLAPGDHLLTASRAGYREQRLTVTLAPDQRTAAELTLEVVTGLVLITTVPPGATVEINNANRGETPLLVTDLPFGSYRLKLTKTGLRPHEHDLTIDSRKPKHIEISLASSSATIQLDSRPSGASVTLNGVDRGTTPCTLDQVPEGEATLELTLAGCEPYRQTLRMQAGEQQTLTAPLKQIPAALSIVSLPAGARIYVNNQFRGEAPVNLANLEPGDYRVRAELEAHEPLARTVTLERAGKLTEEFRLTPNCGSIDVITAPAGVHVFVDGRDCGVTRAPTNETDRVSEPLRIERVALGTHKLELTRKGHFSKETAVVVERDKTVAVQIALEQRFIPDCEVRTATDVFRGVLSEVDPQGNVRLFTRPGVLKTISASDIVSRRALRDDGR